MVCQRSGVDQGTKGGVGHGLGHRAFEGPTPSVGKCKAPAQTPCLGPRVP